MTLPRRVLKRAAQSLPLSRQAALVSRILPRRWWFRASLAFSRLHGLAADRMGGNGVLTQALMLDHWLRQLTFHGAYPLPYRVHGLDVLQTGGARLYTWTHLPLVELPLRAILEHGVTPTSVVADSGKITPDGSFVVFGLQKHPEALRADGGLLLRIRQRWQRGETVCFLADQFFGGELNETPLRLAMRMHVPVVIQWAELAPDRVFDVTFRWAPFPVPETEQQFQANMDFLREAKARMLRALGWPMAPTPA